MCFRELGLSHHQRVFTKCFPCAESAEPFFNVYMDDDSPDLSILIQLLGIRNGVAEGLRMLTMFDKEYQKLWKPLEVKVTFGSVSTVHAQFQDPHDIQVHRTTRTHLLTVSSPKTRTHIKPDLCMCVVKVVTMFK